MASLSEEMQALEQMSQELQKVMAKPIVGKGLKQNLEKQEQMIDRLLNTKKTTMQLIQELMSAEEQVARKLSDRDEELKVSLQKLQQIEDSLLQAKEKDTKLKSITDTERTKELGALREETERQKAAEEDADASMAAMSHLSQLYYRICPIDWDDSCEPTLIKGVHHGPDIAQPFCIDSSQHSRCFVSDYLWSLVPTSW